MNRLDYCLTKESKYLTVFSKYFSIVNLFLVDWVRYSAHFVSSPHTLYIVVSHGLLQLTFMPAENLILMNRGNTIRDRFEMHLLDVYIHFN